MRVRQSNRVAHLPQNKPDSMFTPMASVGFSFPQCRRFDSAALFSGRGCSRSIKDSLYKKSWDQENTIFYAFLFSVWAFSENSMISPYVWWNCRLHNAAVWSPAASWRWVMELSVGQSDSFYSVCSRGKHADVEGFILPFSRPAICGAGQPLLSFPLSSSDKPASDIWFPQAQAERKKLYSRLSALVDVLS